MVDPGLLNGMKIHPFHLGIPALFSSRGQGGDVFIKSLRSGKSLQGREDAPCFKNPAGIERTLHVHTSQ